MKSTLQIKSKINEFYDADSYINLSAGKLFFGKYGKIIFLFD